MPLTYFLHPDAQREEASASEPTAPPADAAGAPAEASDRSYRLSEAVASTATKLLPLVSLLDAIQPQVAQDSVFHLRRLKIQESLAAAYAELRAERPRRRALSHAFHTLAELVREETHDISKDELKQAAKEVVLATLQHAPALINIAHQARLLS
jgi:hypothetical protein